MYHGVINVYKEPGYTSHDVVACLRGILRQKKIGHTGTLDPAAQGVLPVCLGQATRLCDMLADESKAYEAVLLLGMQTDTQDTTGRVLAQAEVQVSEEEVCRAAEGFLGEYWQVPPMYSALKVDGKKLYELARAGKEVERQARPVDILELNITKIELPRVWMTVTCSKGTYIRTLCSDIGDKLGCGGCMEALKRVRVGAFLAENALTLSDIEKLRDDGRIGDALVSVEDALSAYPSAVTSQQADRLVKNGNPLTDRDFVREADGSWGGRNSDTVRVSDSQGHFLGVYRCDKERGFWKPWKMFLNLEE